MRIEVKTENEDKTLNIYVFTIFDTVAVFSELLHQYKPEGKKVWKIRMLWDRLSLRDSIIEEPLLTDAVRKLAYDEIIKKIQVKTWKEFRGNN